MKRGKFVGIELNDAFDLLLQADEACLDHKQILWAGICAWLKRSSSHLAARKAIAKQTARAIMLAEKEARDKVLPRVLWGSKPLGAATTSRKAIALNGLAYSWGAADPRFRTVYKIYFQIGGMEQIVGAYKSPKKTRLTKTTKKRAKPRRKVGFRNLMLVATMFDYHHRELSSDARQFGKPSVEKASKALCGVVKIKGATGKVKGFSRSQIQELLKEHRHAVALLYGAHCVRVGDATLFELLIGKAPLLNEVAQHLPEWLSYGRYFQEQVLSGAMGNWTKTYSPNLKSVSAQQPAIDPLASEQVEHIKATFREKRPSEAKVR